MSDPSSLRIFLRRFAVAFVVSALLGSTAVLVANVVGNSKLAAIPRIKLPDNLLTPSKPGAPTNYLLIGSDTRAFVDTPAERKAFGDVGGARSDVMMVVHTEPALGTALVVSFPRDTYVAIPGHGHDKLNAAFAYGGAALTIKTFQQDFGIPIQHYLAVNFLGFERIVDAIGHVKIYFPTPALDTFTGLYQPVAGCASLGGVQALAYARSRHYQIPATGVTNANPKVSGDWVEDPRQDLDRILRQQYFLRSLGQAALNHGASNPLTALRLADAVISSVTADQSLTRNDVKSLVRTFRGLNPAKVEMTTLPVTSGPGGLVTQYPEAQPVLDRLADLSLPSAPLPQPVSPARVRVVVVDGSGTPGRAAAVERALVERGFREGGAGEADRAYPKTQVRYAPGKASKGLTTALYLGTANVVETTSTRVSLGGRLLAGDVIVVLGRDYPSLRGLLSEPPPSSTTGTTSTTGATATSTPSGGAGTTSTSTTTTTVPAVTPDTRYVPTAAHGLGPLVGCP